MPVKCVVCNKKISSVHVQAYTCRCGQCVCGVHKPTTEHDCTFDHRQTTKQQLVSKLPLIKTFQIEKI